MKRMISLLTSLKMITTSLILIWLNLVISEDISDEAPPLFVFSSVVSMSSNLSRPRSVSTLEEVMEAEVRIARCQVRCLEHWSSCSSSPVCGQCQHVCRMLVETPVWTSLCSAPGKYSSLIGLYTRILISDWLTDNYKICLSLIG